jgi:ring-1,2-phenylacetyl-CoA epoxidase subunit PaaE
LAKHLHTVKVKNVNKETADCVSIEFDITEELWPTFRYKQGQSISIKSNQDQVRRSYSICSSPFQNKLIVAVKRVPKGVFSTYATEELKAGDELEIMEPSGNFNTELNPENAKNYLFFAAGSGITPIISIIRTILKEEPKSRVSLVYGNRTVSSIIFKDELEGMKNLFIDRLDITHVISREPADSPLNSGRIDEAKLKVLEKLLDYRNVDEVFVCGPEQMIFTVRDFFKARGLDGKKIHFELFTTEAMREANAPEEEKPGEAKKNGNGSAGISQVTITVDGRTYEVEVPYKKPTILDAGLNEGINLPYSCKGGVCTTCRAKLLEGEVEMDCNYGLEDSEVEEGYILTCQSHPRTPGCKVDYDQ